MRSTNRRKTRLRLESLEARNLRATAVYSVGPGLAYATPDQVPWSHLGAGAEVDIYWQPTPYYSKIDLTSSGRADAPIVIQGIAGPNGQLPQLNAVNAVENTDASYFTDQIAYQGVITVAPSATAGWTDEVHNIVISGLELTGATRDASFTAYDGSTQWYNWGASGVALYRARDITIQNCTIDGNEDGIFGKSFGYAGGDLWHIVVSQNHIWGNGVVGQDHYHDTYIEGWYTLYACNTYGPLVNGALGVALKDRSVSPTIAFNWISGGVAQLDLVDPDDGASDMVGDPAYGNVYVYGNILVDPESAAHVVHFGFDQLAADSQKTLYFYDNTVIVENSYPDGSGRYYTTAFKLNGGTTLYAFDNIFALWSPEGEWAGNFYLTTVEFGSAHAYLGANVVPDGTFTDDGTGVTVAGFGNLIFGDPGFVDIQNGNYQLTSSSPALGAAKGMYDGQEFCSLTVAGLPAVDWQWDFANGGGWVPRDTTSNIGDWESDW